MVSGDMIEGTIGNNLLNIEYVGTDWNLCKHISHDISTSRCLACDVIHTEPHLYNRNVFDLNYYG